jgi:hypothetical protein
MKKYIFLFLCAAVLVLGIVHQAAAQPELNRVSASASRQQHDRDSVLLFSTSPGEIQPDSQMSDGIQPEIWFGLAISLFGALVFWSSVLWMSRRRAYR